MKNKDKIIRNIGIFIVLSSIIVFLGSMFLKINGINKYIHPLFYLLIGLYLLFLKKISLNLKLLFGMIIVFLIIMEIILRIISPGCNAYYERDIDIRYKHIPNTINCKEIKDGFNYNVKSNSDGFLDTEFTYNENSLRIFLLGDSFAHCLEADYESCAHNILEKNLNLYSEKRIEIFNFGLGGYGGVDELLVLKKYGEIYKPNIVILYFLAQNDLKDNDAALNWLDKKEKSGEEKFKIMVWTLNVAEPIIKIFKIRAFDFFVDSINNICISFSEMCKKRAAYHLMGIDNYEVYLSEISEKWKKRWNKEFEIIDQIKEESKKIGAELVIIPIASSEQVYEEDWKRITETFPILKGKDYDFSRPNEKIIEYCKENNIKCFNLLPYFKKEYKRLYHYKDGHWNNEGQEFAAKTMFEFLINNNIIAKEGIK